MIRGFYAAGGNKVRSIEVKTKTGNLTHPNNYFEFVCMNASIIEFISEEGTVI